MILPVLVLAAACVPVHEPVLRVGDLAKAVPSFQAVEPSAPIGYAPVPGSRRVVSESEMARLSKRFGVEGEPREVCFEWAMKKLSADIVVEAVRKAVPQADVSVVELPTFDVPEGVLRFSLAALPKSIVGRGDNPVVWRGAVEYAPGRNFAVWAKVRIAVVGKRLEPLHDLAAGETISADDVELREFRAVPGSTEYLSSLEEAIGRKLLVGVKSGNGFTASVLAPVEKAVERGDDVAVQVHSGGALIKVSAKADSSAALGQTVKLRNAKSGKVFEGKVIGKRTASVTAVTSEEIQ